MPLTQKDVELLRGDFRNFLFFIFTTTLHLPSPTRGQYLLAGFLADGSNRRRIVEAFRGVGKSWITAVYALWRLWKDPNEHILVVSASKARADDFSTFCHRILQGCPLLAAMMPRTDQRFSKIAWDVNGALPSQAPSVKSLGITSQLTGSRATLIIGDDCEVPNNSATEDQREKLLQRMLEFEAIIVPGGEIVLLGTPQTQESVYGKFKERGYVIKVLPARYPNRDFPDLFQELVDDLDTTTDLQGKPTDPTRFNDTELLSREAVYGRAGFMLQFMLDTSLSDLERYPLRCRDLVVMNLNPEQAPVGLTWGSSLPQQIKSIPNLGMSGDRFYAPFWVDSRYCPYEGTVMAIDPSGRGKDELGVAVVKQLHGRLFVLEATGLKGGYEDGNLKRLAIMAKELRVNHVIIESNFGDGMFTKIFSPILAQLHPCTVEEVRHSTQKEKRIADVLEPVMNQHRVIMDQALLERDAREALVDPVNCLQYSLLYQLTHLTRERGSLRHDDRLDALAMAVGYWVEAMARDQGKALVDWEERTTDEALKSFMADVGVKVAIPGIPKEPPSRGRLAWGWCKGARGAVRRG